MTSGYIAAASFAQRQLRYLDMLQPGGSQYAIPLVLEITGPVCQAALRQAFNAVIDRHDVLRASFPLVDDTPLLAVLAPLVIDMPEERGRAWGMGRVWPVGWISVVSWLYKNKKN